MVWIWRGEMTLAWTEGGVGDKAGKAEAVNAAVLSTGPLQEQGTYASDPGAAAGRSTLMANSSNGLC